MSIPAIERKIGDRLLDLPYKCFCCQDGGLIANPYLEQYVFELGTHSKRFICQRYGCESGARYMAAFNRTTTERLQYAAEKGTVAIRTSDYQANFDDRMDANACEQLHKAAKEDWLQMVRARLSGEQQQEICLEAQQLAAGMAFPVVRIEAIEEIGA